MVDKIKRKNLKLNQSSNLEKYRASNDEFWKGVAPLGSFYFKNEFNVRKKLKYSELYSNLVSTEIPEKFRGLRWKYFLFPLTRNKLLIHDKNENILFIFYFYYSYLNRCYNFVLMFEESLDTKDYTTIKTFNCKIVVHSMYSIKIYNENFRLLNEIKEETLSIHSLSSTQIFHYSGNYGYGSNFYDSKEICLVKNVVELKVDHFLDNLILYRDDQNNKITIFDRKLNEITNSINLLALYDMPRSCIANQSNGIFIRDWNGFLAYDLDGSYLFKSQTLIVKYFEIHFVNDFDLYLVDYNQINLNIF